MVDTPAQTIGDDTGSATLAAGQHACYRVSTSYPISTPSADVQESQSDQVTWQLKFHGDLS